MESLRCCSSGEAFFYSITAISEDYLKLAFVELNITIVVGDQILLL